MMDEECKEYTRHVFLVREILQKKWTLQILCAMRRQPVRLSQLTRIAPSASKKALRASLRSLEAAGIVIRHDLSHVVLHVEYDFVSDMRETVSSVLDHLAEWGTILENRTVLK